MRLLPKDGIGEVEAGEASLAGFSNRLAQEEERSIRLAMNGDVEVQCGVDDRPAFCLLSAVYQPRQFPAQPGLAGAGAAVKDEYEGFGALVCFERGLEDGDRLFPVNELSDRGR
jgi:hypothetical protein